MNEKDQIRQMIHCDHILRGNIERNHNLLKSFESAHPDLFEIIEDCLEAGQMLSVCSMKESIGKSGRFLSIMWQALCSYHFESALAIMSDSIDTGLSILRSAAELSRDIDCIGKDKTKVELWLDGRSAGPKSARRSKAYRNAFRFDTQTELGKATHKFYEVCCDLGVHNHFTDFASSDFECPIYNDGEVTYMQLSHRKRLKFVCVWLKGFLLTASLSARPMITWQRPLLNKALKIFYDFTDNLKFAIKSINQSISDWDSEEAQKYWDAHMEFLSADTEVRH